MGKIRAYYINSPDTEIPIEDWARFGVLYWHIPVETLEEDGILDNICKERNYNYKDIVHLTPTTLPNYEEKVKIFFEEHLHRDEEIRYFLDGSGYFDVRDHEDRWVRIHAFKGDMLVLPAGIYHRYSNDSNNAAKVMRLFQGEPVWTAFNRSNEVDEFPIRKEYLKEIVMNQ